MITRILDPRQRACRSIEQTISWNICYWDLLISFVFRLDSATTTQQVCCWVETGFIRPLACLKRLQSGAKRKLDSSKMPPAKRRCITKSFSSAESSPYAEHKEEDSGGKVVNQKLEVDSTDQFLSHAQEESAALKQSEGTSAILSTVLPLPKQQTMRQPNAPPVQHSRILKEQSVDMQSKQAHSFPPTLAEVLRKPPPHSSPIQSNLKPTQSPKSILNLKAPESSSKPQDDGRNSQQAAISLQPTATVKSPPSIALQPISALSQKTTHSSEEKQDNKVVPPPAFQALPTTKFLRAYPVSNPQPRPKSMDSSLIFSLRHRAHALSPNQQAITTLSPEHLSMWLCSQNTNLREISELLCNQKIDGSAFLRLTESDLRELGILMGHRKNLLALQEELLAYSIQ